MQENFLNRVLSNIVDKQIGWNMCISYRQFHNAFANLQVSGRQWRDDPSDVTSNMASSPIKQAMKQVRTW